MNSFQGLCPNPIERKLLTHSHASNTKKKRRKVSNQMKLQLQRVIPSPEPQDWKHQSLCLLWPYLIHRSQIMLGVPSQTMVEVVIMGAQK